MKSLEIGLSNGNVLTVTGTEDDPVSLEDFQEDLSKVIDDDGIWIATGIDGEHWAIADNIFRRTYERCD